MAKLWEPRKHTLSYYSSYCSCALHFTLIGLLDCLQSKKSPGLLIVWCLMDYLSAGNQVKPVCCLQWESWLKKLLSLFITALDKNFDAMPKFTISKVWSYGWFWGHAANQVTEMFEIVTRSSRADGFEGRFVITTSTNCTINVIAECKSTKETWKSMKAHKEWRVQSTLAFQLSGQQLLGTAKRKGAASRHWFSCMQHIWSQHIILELQIL